MQMPLFADQPDYAPTGLLDYRAIPRLSNSELTRFRDEYRNRPSIFTRTKNRLQLNAARPNRDDEPAARRDPETIGTIIDQLLPDWTASEATRFASLLPVLRQDSFCRRYLTPTAYRHVERERVLLFTEPTTGLRCKARLDAVYTSPKRQNALVLDVKTTSARTQSQFLQSCYDDDCDRQAAFYLDALRLDESRYWADTRQFRLVFVGVARQEPHRLFVVDATSIPGFVTRGRRQYRSLLRDWRDMNQPDSESARFVLPMSA